MSRCETPRPDPIRIIGRLVTSSGLSDPFVIHDAGGANIQDIAVTAEGSAFQVVWMKRLGAIECPYLLVDPGPPPSPPFGLDQIHVDQDGSSGTPATLTEGGPSDEQPAIASNGAALALVWIESNPVPYYTAKIAAAIAHPGQQVVPIPIASSAAAQSDPVIAAAEGVFMTAWREEQQNDGTSAIYAKRFNTDGRPLDAEAIRVSTKDRARASTPSVSFDGAVWLFVWIEDVNMFVRRMTLDGNWMDAAPMTITPPSSVYAVAPNGNGFAVLTLTGKPALTIVPRTGDMHQVPVPLNLGFTEYLTSPSMAWDGIHYTAVWTHGNTDDIEGIRLDQDGQIITSRFDIAKTKRTEWSPSIACHEGECMVAWYSNDQSPRQRSLTARRCPSSLRRTA